MAVFFVNGVAGASWFTRIPAVQQRLALSPGALGVVLLGLTIGSLLSMTLAGGLVARFGSRPVTTAGTFAYCAALPLPALAPSAPLLLLALIAFGVGNGTMDVSMNAQAVAVERRYGRPIMSSFHGLFSVGGIVGAAAGGLI
ncbi:MAG: MFS transporter, partial [Thermomicrobiaceae bacterium]|nr:MFS transporter [Thermomicrobiaceae bacterium]